MNNAREPAPLAQNLGLVQIHLVQYSPLTKLFAVKKWGRRDLNREDFASLVLWAQILLVQFLLLTILFAAEYGVGGI